MKNVCVSLLLLMLVACGGKAADAAPSPGNAPAGVTRISDPNPRSSRFLERDTAEVSESELLEREIEMSRYVSEVHALFDDFETPMPLEKYRSDAEKR